MNGNMVIHIVDSYSILFTKGGNMNENKSRLNTFRSINHNKSLFCTYVQFHFELNEVDNLIIFRYEKNAIYMQIFINIFHSI